VETDLECGNAVVEAQLCRHSAVSSSPALMTLCLLTTTCQPAATQPCVSMTTDGVCSNNNDDRSHLMTRLAISHIRHHSSCSSVKDLTSKRDCRSIKDRQPWTGCTDTFLLLWPWPWSHDLDIPNWPRYSEDVPVCQTWSF